MQKWECLTAYVDYTYPQSVGVYFVNGIAIDPKGPFAKNGKLLLSPWLEKIGTDGWELVAASSAPGYLYFKRPKS